jgi:diguanylate cyclase (GGDEF)-like protein
MKKKRMAGTQGAAKRMRRGRRRASASHGAGTPVSPQAERHAVRRLKAELARATQRIEELTETAERDFLLDIFNRRGFARELNRSIDYIKRYQAIGALIMLDVDRLKPINDAFGHAAGDQVLKAVASTLTEQVRSSDVVGRLGGDEFGVLLWNLSEADARDKAVALELAIDDLSFTFDNNTVRAGASAGVAILDLRADAQSALDAADRAMYIRKAQRRLQASMVTKPAAEPATETAGHNSPRSSGT